MNRVLKYEHLEGYFVVLGLILPEIRRFLFPIPPKFWFQKRVDELDLWRHFLSYCRVTKSLPKLFGCAT